MCRERMFELRLSLPWDGYVYLLRDRGQSRGPELVHPTRPAEHRELPAGPAVLLHGALEQGRHRFFAAFSRRPLLDLSDEKLEADGCSWSAETAMRLRDQVLLELSRSVQICPVPVEAGRGGCLGPACDDEPRNPDAARG